MSNFEKLKTFEPLPSNVTIKKSRIHGLGLFAKSNICSDSVLGVTHVKDKRFSHGYIRTPLGGFVNHSEDPNCVKVFEEEQWGKIYHMRTIKPIKKDEELFLKYTFYNV